jgi:hypothetical protein
MLETFTINTFSSLIGDEFRLHVAGLPPVPLELIEATLLDGDSAAPAEHGRRIPFSIVFRGLREPFLVQRLYVLEHATIGRFELFIVPIGPDARGMRYEAVFA